MTGQSNRARRWRRIAWRALLALLLLALVFSGAIGFGVLPRDRARIDAFADAVRRWQVNPDFRDVQREYVTLGVDAMRARLCGLSAQTIVMGFRSLPGLPESLSVKDSSATHYRAFSAGELPAYLHLSGEQDVPNGIAMIENLGKRDPLSDGEIVKFLSDFKVPVPVVTDAGAVASVRRLLSDVQPEPFTIRDHFAEALTSHTGSASLEALDAELKRTDVELWRTKQVNDLLAGIWAQSYGMIYLDAIDVFRRIQLIARIICVLALACLITAWVFKLSPLDPRASAAGDVG